MDRWSKEQIAGETDERELDSQSVLIWVKPHGGHSNLIYP